MNCPESVQAVLTRSHAAGSDIIKSIEGYPTSIIDILIYHRLHLHMEPAVAVKSYAQLNSEFVDWNEVRISPLREIQEQVSKARDSLELSVFIKDLLEFVHSSKHKIDLEWLETENLMDVRRHLKQVRNIEPCSIDLILHLRKAHPIVPLTSRMEALAGELSLLSPDDNRDRKQKALFEAVGADAALAFHHFFLDISRAEDLPDKAKVKALNAFLGQLPGGERKGERTKKAKPRKAAASNDD